MGAGQRKPVGSSNDALISSAPFRYDAAIIAGGVAALHFPARRRDGSPRAASVRASGVALPPLFRTTAKLPA
jgi:hypothetical protein